MLFARRVFMVAGVYGVLVLFPLYFEDAGPRPEFYYGFVGLALVWQLAFLLISRDPVRYRPLMIVAVLEKMVFGIPTLVLYLQGRVDAQMLAAATIDLILGALFLTAWVRLGSTVNQPAVSPPAGG
jgi:hypothetical protein